MRAIHLFTAVLAVAFAATCGHSETLADGPAPAGASGPGFVD